MKVMHVKFDTFWVLYEEVIAVSFLQTQQTLHLDLLIHNESESKVGGYVHTQFEYYAYKFSWDFDFYSKSY